MQEKLLKNIYLTLDFEKKLFSHKLFLVGILPVIITLPDKTTEKVNLYMREEIKYHTFLREIMGKTAEQARSYEEANLQINSMLSRFEAVLNKAQTTLKCGQRDILSININENGTQTSEAQRLEAERIQSKKGKRKRI